MITEFSYTREIAISIMVGLLDSDGSIGWTWDKSNDNAFIPSMGITQKTNFGILVWIYMKLQIGSTTQSTKSWGIKNQKRMLSFFLAWVFLDQSSYLSCRLMTSKRLDGVLMYFALEMVQTKFHKTQAGKAILIFMRTYMHWGFSRTNVRTPAQQLELLNISDAIYQQNIAKRSAARLKVAQSKIEFRNHTQNMERILTNQFAALGKTDSNLLINGWQVVGFFLGDGGVHVVWGTKIMTCVLTWTGDRQSAKALEFYSYSLLRNGVRRKAWKSQRKNVSRLMISGVDSFCNNVILFFNEYPIPECEKLSIFKGVAKAAILLNELKQSQIWTENQKKRLKKIIFDTWNLNPSGPSRKFGSPAEYFAHVCARKAEGNIAIR